MKIFTKRILKEILTSKVMLLIIGLYCSLGGYIYLNHRFRNMLIKNSRGIYIIYHGIYFQMIVAYIMIPIFLILICKTSVYFNHRNVILKYKNLKGWFRDKNITNVILALIYTLIMNIPLFIILTLDVSILHKGIQPIFIIVMLFQFIGFLILQSLYLIIESVINFRGSGFFGVMFLIMICEFGKIGLNLDMNSLVEYMSLVNKAVVNNYNTTVIDFFILGVYFVTFILMYKIGINIITNKDIDGGKKI
ncbi:hypothetical protein [Clostridium botulinum]|uniref:Uncharacterized protein n=1 Tax=Clostridium botulinum TaxID=1491 RepID=A0A9Q1UYG2_CLOBO|nr:hypothetical protein [Clostridium botulinum]AEB76820.1 hypothetical protein CbC4_2155 [Clostridium botulinum BKT015925]KEI02597.1 hypothetical protein Z953_06855 [Clostridium botulinum D str. 16868]KEI02698.1 hypothetical protein Y848_06875 [Clostridium botulinum C/D str. Sp77]KLU74749.1 hypothetical protein CBC3_12575 [Clostridium botulinum V891]KOA76953.1 hypothetical protein ADU78_05175 [Clostridium botulinum]